MKVWASIKFMLGGSSGVKKNVGAREMKWDGELRMLDGDWIVMIKRVVMDVNAIELDLILIEERV